MLRLDSVYLAVLSGTGSKFAFFVNAFTGEKPLDIFLFKADMYFIFQRQFFAHPEVIAVCFRNGTQCFQNIGFSASVLADQHGRQSVIIVYFNRFFYRLVIFNFDFCYSHINLRKQLRRVFVLTTDITLGNEFAIHIKTCSPI